MAKKVVEKQVEIPQINVQVVSFHIVGKSPLVVHKFSQKVKEKMLGKMKKEVQVRELKNPEQEYKDSIYFFKDGKRTGFPLLGFKMGMVRAAKQANMAMTDARGMFHVLADEGDLIEIKGKHYMREDNVTVGMGSADIRYRAEYPEWSAIINIEYNAHSISVEQLANLLNVAGFSSGIGEWRPERNGFMGRYALKSGK